jgi:WD40 repeat protein
MSVAFSPDGKSLAVGFGEYSHDRTYRATLYEAATGKETATFPGPKGGVNDLAFHPDGRHVAVAGLGIVEVWDVVSQTKARELRGHSNWVYCLAFSPDGKWLATGGWDRTIKLRDAASGAERLTIFAHDGFVLDLAFSPDSRTLASTSEDRSVRLWEIPTGRQIGVCHGHTDFVQAAAFAPDGRELASGGLEGTMKVWDLRSSLPVVFKEDTQVVVGLWYRRDGRRVVSVPSPASGPGIMKGWDPSTGEPDPTLTGIDPDKLPDEYVAPSSYHAIGTAPYPVTSSDSKLVARVTRSTGVYQSDQRSKSYSTTMVEVMDAATGQALHNLIGHTADVTCIAFSPDGHRIATASYDRTVKLWDTATGREVFTLRGHTAGVIALAFSPGGHRIVSGGIDNSARVWDATPLPADTLQAQQASYQQKQEKIKPPKELAGREHADAMGHAEGENNYPPKSHWELVAASLGKYVERDVNPNVFPLRYRHILALVEVGNAAGVRRACEDLLKRFDNTTDPGQAIIVAWSCIVAADAVADYGVPIRLAEAALAGRPERGKERSEALSTLGAALYRAGRFEEALRRLTESIQALDGEGAPRGFAFLALAHHRLGHHDEAKRWLEKLEAYQLKEGFEFSWDDVDIRILRREAESLILGSRPAASPTSDPAPIKNTTAPPAVKPE